ncbi:MAG: hypothetical protein RLY58_248 [Pseudomonadota bacterium]|jgi:hypothetical protein
MIKTFHDQNRPQPAADAVATGVPAPLFTGAVTHQVDPVLAARLDAVGGLSLLPTSPARIALLLTQLPNMDASAALQLGQAPAELLNRLIDDASHLMLHPTLQEIRQLLDRILATLAAFSAPYQRKTGWLNRLLGQDAPAVLTQEQYLNTRIALTRLLEGLRPHLARLPTLRQRLVDLKDASGRTRHQFDEIIAAILIHLEDHPDTASNAMTESISARLSRRLVTLRTLADSSSLQVRQLEVSIEQLHQLQERLNDVQQVIYPLWQQQCMAVLSGQQQQHALDGFMQVQQQFMDSLSQSANQLRGSSTPP